MSAERDAYVKKIQAKLDEWNADIDKLEARAKGAQADAQLACNKRIEEMKTRRDELNTRLQEIRNSSGEAWEDLRSGVELAWESMSEAVQSAWSHFR